MVFFLKKRYPTLGRNPVLWVRLKTLESHTHKQPDPEQLPAAQQSSLNLRDSRVVNFLTSTWTKMAAKASIKYKTKFSSLKLLLNNNIIGPD